MRLKADIRREQEQRKAVEERLKLLEAEKTGVGEERSQVSAHVVDFPLRRSTRRFHGTRHPFRSYFWCPVLAFVVAHMEVFSLKGSQTFAG